MFMSAMEATVIATAMPTVIADLRGVELYGWVGAIYMLATTVTIPIWGKLADVWGRKAVMFVGSSNNGVPCMVDFRSTDIHAPFPST